MRVGPHGGLSASPAATWSTGGSLSPSRGRHNKCPRPARQVAWPLLRALSPQRARRLCADSDGDRHTGPVSGHPPAPPGWALAHGPWKPRTELPQAAAAPGPARRTVVRATPHTQFRVRRGRLASRATRRGRWQPPRGAPSVKVSPLEAPHAGEDGAPRPASARKRDTGGAMCWRLKPPTSVWPAQAWDVPADGFSTPGEGGRRIRRWRWQVQPPVKR